MPLNLKNKKAPLRILALMLTLLVFGNCSSKLAITKIEGRDFPVTQEKGTNGEIEAVITPYREKIDHDMNVILAYAPQTLDKSGKWQTPVGDFLADITLDAANKILMQRYARHVDACLLNAGGIRSIIPQGNITTRTAFEIMPFENLLVVTELGDSQIQELLNFIIADKKPHPISGLTFSISQDGKAQNIRIGNQNYDPDKKYLFATSDYLYNGGDNMLFLKNGSSKFDTDYKLRNIMIDYFTKVDTVNKPKDQRIFPEP